MTMNDGSRITGCTVPGLSGGGGVAVDSGALFVMNGGLIDNCEVQYGGGVYLRSARFVMNGGYIQNCRSRVSGGGVDISVRAGQSAEATLAGGVICDNTAEENGGGVNLRVSGKDSSASLVLNGTHITGNTARQGGGIGYNLSGNASANSELVLNAGSITDNIANDFGGGVYVHYEPSAMRFSVGEGGEVEIAGNQAQSGGGLCFEGKGQTGAATVANAHIHGNTASTAGGIMVMDARLTLAEGALVAENHADMLGGGVVNNALNTHGSRLTLAGGRVEHNTTDGAGGGLANQASNNGSAELFLVSGIVRGNSAKDAGGGVYQKLYGASAASPEANVVFGAGQAAGSLAITGNTAPRGGAAAAGYADIPGADWLSEFEFAGRPIVGANLYDNAINTADVVLTAVADASNPEHSALSQDALIHLEGAATAGMEFARFDAPGRQKLAQAFRHTGAGRLIGSAGPANCIEWAEPVVHSALTAFPTWYRGDGGALAGAYSGNADDLLYLAADRAPANLAPGTDYTAESGNTLLTLQNSWLNMQTQGQHTLLVAWRDGYADVELDLRNGVGPVANPQTGDDSGIGLWVALLCTSFAALAAGAWLFFWRKRSAA